MARFLWVVCVTVTAAAAAAEAPAATSEALSAATAAVARRDWIAAVSAYEVALGPTANLQDPDDDGSGVGATRADVDNRVGYARALKKVSRHDDALAQLDAAGAAMAAVIRGGGTTRAEQLHSKASVAFERGVVLACAGRLEDAIAAQVRCHGGCCSARSVVRY